MSAYNESDNYRFYDAADLTKQPRKFRNKKLFIIHGTADKKVHIRHSMAFARALQKENVLFRQLVSISRSEFHP